MLCTPTTGPYRLTKGRMAAVIAAEAKARSRSRAAQKLKRVYQEWDALDEVTPFWPPAPAAKVDKPAQVAGEQTTPIGEAVLPHRSRSLRIHA